MNLNKTLLTMALGLALKACEQQNKEQQMQYRKKPIVIEAFCWTGDLDQTEDPIWIVDAINAGVVCFTNSGTPDVRMHVCTSEGEMCAAPGDWIIKGIKGELYPCKPDIFAATYDPVEHKAIGVMPAGLSEDVRRSFAFQVDALVMMRQRGELDGDEMVYGAPRRRPVITRATLMKAMGFDTPGAENTSIHVFAFDWDAVARELSEQLS